LSESVIILGIDPGTNVTGFGLIKVCGDKISPLLIDELLLKKIPDHYDRLEKIYQRTAQIIAEYSPHEVALEAQFFGQNVQSMIKLGRAQGVAMSAALAQQILVVEYAPKKVKMAITGNGNASKEQLALTLKDLLNIKKLPKSLDATDGLAIAVCHAYNRNRPSSSKKTNWATFVSQNPDKVIS
jgi:crossover junction endodeoxyribonuclease RuvC